MRKVWVLKFVAGNPEFFSKVNTDPRCPTIRSKALQLAEQLNPKWRVWVEHLETGERIFESDAEKTFKGKE